jgi:hypothetical protein
MRQRPTLTNLEKRTSEAETNHEHDGEWRAEAERKEEQRASGTAIFG